MSRSPDSASRILFVDDDADTRDMISILLGQSGYHVTTAGDIAGALLLAEAERFDLYMLDNWMPDGEGTQLCQRLRMLYPTSPILFYSGVAYESDIQRAKDAGADAYLVKPCDSDQVKNAIVKLLDKKDSGMLNTRSKQLLDTRPARS